MSNGGGFSSVAGDGREDPNRLLRRRFPYAALNVVLQRPSRERSVVRVARREHAAASDRDD
jgi:hypothetical protein